MEAPKLCEHGSSRDTSLFVRSVHTYRVQKPKLEPGCYGVTVGKTSLIRSPVGVRFVCQFRLVSQMVTPVILEKTVVHLSELLLKINLVAFLVTTDLSVSPICW